MKIAETYRRDKVLPRMVNMLRKYFPPKPDQRVADVIDVTEAALKQVLPGYHVRVNIERIGANGNGGPH